MKSHSCVKQRPFSQWTAGNNRKPYLNRKRNAPYAETKRPTSMSCDARQIFLCYAKAMRPCCSSDAVIIHQPLTNCLRSPNLCDHQSATPTDCRSCQLPLWLLSITEVVSGIPLTVEHILPKALGGIDDDENLWLSCRSCNERKGSVAEAIDPDTGALVPLFNPRTQNWNAHFVWQENGIWLSGKTAIGRATVEALALNHELRVRARSIWVRAGLHPPH